MTLGISILTLAFAAALEASGDAVIRLGLHQSEALRRVMLFVCGAAILFAYGWTVNRPPWDFGRLLGLYVVFFFIIAQLISYFVFHQKPSWAVIIGGVLISSGGVIISAFQ